jgi:hypothetical protein
MIYTPFGASSLHCLSMLGDPICGGTNSNEASGTQESTLLSFVRN